MRHIDKIIIHCTATKEGVDVSAATINDWHIHRGWKGIGYHFVIRLDGSIEKGRPVEQIGAHVQGMNRNSIGVVYVGGLDQNKKPKDTRTKKQKKALIELIADLQDQFPEATIHGHNEFAAKACPCFDVQSEFAPIKESEDA